MRSTLLTVVMLCMCAPTDAFDISEDGIVVRTKDGSVELEISGRLHVDTAFFDDHNIDDGLETRRARLGAKLTLLRDYELEYACDHAGEGHVLGASLNYVGFDTWEIRMGQFKEPFSLDESTSSNHITFMERALPNVFAPGYNSGVALFTHGENWSAAGGLFGDDVIKDVFGSGDDGKSATARFTFAPLHRDREVWHLGLSASAREIDENSRVRFTTDPESSVAGENLVSTGSIRDTERVYLAGVEAALVKGPISAQAEYVHTHLIRESARSDLNFSGWYAFVSWFLTGESRPYRVKRGTFGRLTPGRESGAWELGLRASHVDLSDRTIRGGRQYDLTLGLNWYYGRNMRLRADFVHAETDAAGGDEEVNLFQFRAQWSF